MFFEIGHLCGLHVVDLCWRILWLSSRYRYSLRWEMWIRIFLKLGQRRILAWPFPFVLEISWVLVQFGLWVGCGWRLFSFSSISCFRQNFSGKGSICVWAGEGWSHYVNSWLTKNCRKALTVEDFRKNLCWSSGSGVWGCRASVLKVRKKGVLLTIVSKLVL